MESITAPAILQTFALLPAAGYSRRMGAPKLLLPWGAHTLLDAVLAQWRAAAVTHIVLVVRADDHALEAVARHYPVHVITADPPPPEMKDSIRLGLEWIGAHLHPTQDDVWLLSPADVPSISAPLITRLLVAHRAHPHNIVVPQFDGRRGHPVLFPWTLAGEVKQLAADEGVNALLCRHPVIELAADDERVLQDVDTRQDYEQLRPS